jgi:hypothetical protein
VNTIPWQTEMSWVIAKHTGALKLTANWYDGFLCDELTVGIKGVQNNQDEDVEDINQSALHNNADENDETERGRNKAVGHSVLLPDSICDHACGHSILDECESVDRVHPMNERG